MNYLDWLVLVGTITFITLYGIWKNRKQQNDVSNFLIARKTMPWYAISFSIIATQASAITFISAPGQGFIDGLRFVQFYLGLPIAMVVLSITIVPIYYKLNVFTAYQYLENRFDLRTRVLTSGLFLLQRGLSTAISILAPSIVLSVLLGWNVYWVNVVIGSLVIFYTMTGGTKAVNQTQQQQLLVVLLGMLSAGYLVAALLPKEVSAWQAMQIAGKMDKMQAINFNFDWNEKYNFWSGLIGGFFLQLSYFGTDQSQVGRYLTGTSIKQGRLGLLFNGIFKIPMQLAILWIGVMLFVFYQFQGSPLFFNPVEVAKVKQGAYKTDFEALERQNQELAKEKEQHLIRLTQALKAQDEPTIQELKQKLQVTEETWKWYRKEAIKLIKQNDKLANTNDTNYIFLGFVLKYLPHGIIGLIIAVVFSSAMSSIAAAYHSLASTTLVDIYKRTLVKEATEKHYLKMSQYFTLFWGIFCIIFAQFAVNLGTLIEIVNILGSLFYGTILGIFLVGFYMPYIKANAAFYAVIVAEAVVFYVYFFVPISYLWLNVIGCLAVMLLGFVLQIALNNIGKDKIS